MNKQVESSPWEALMDLAFRRRRSFVSRGMLRQEAGSVHRGSTRKRTTKAYRKRRRKIAAASRRRNRR